jgi:hypothetical protein
MLVWGGTGINGAPLNSGGAYGGDRDGDGAGDACDCAPSDPGASSVPEEVDGLHLAADKTTLTWSTLPSLGSGGTYQLLRGATGAGPVGSSPETCVASALIGPTQQDAVLPAAGSGFWYLVRGRNVCGLGTYGSSSAGNERISTTCP